MDKECPLLIGKGRTRKGIHLSSKQEPKAEVCPLKDGNKGTYPELCIAAKLLRCVPLYMSASCGMYKNSSKGHFLGNNREIIP